MSALVAILTLLLVAAVVIALSSPLRRSRRCEREPAVERGALEAARDAKYREIRDAELDYRTGKLSDEDYEALSQALRAEAIGILDRLAAVDGAPPRGEATPRGASAGSPR